MNARVVIPTRALLRIACTVTFALTNAAAVARPDGALSIAVTGFASREGRLMIAVHNTRETFLTRRQPFLAAKVPIDGDTVRYSFADVPAGTYSVAVFHDANANDDLDGVLRIPTERYGFSRNPRNRFGPPKYEETTFTFSGADTTVFIALRGAILR